MLSLRAVKVNVPPSVLGNKITKRSMLVAKNTSHFVNIFELRFWSLAFVSTLIFIGGMYIICVVYEKDRPNQTNLPFIVENLKSAKRGDFVRMKNGELHIISYANPNWIRLADRVNPRQTKPEISVDSLAPEVEFVCRKKTDPVIWKNLCAEYVSKMMEIPYNESPATQPK